ncbi:hypothetical protein AB0P21_07045 [Kribbella sp. NPDC056861]|uniref:hypothetical protein n=1 Tax=Kribbella sp. NPDC056861 TaxID=3154857 RepID=UPI003442B245
MNNNPELARFREHAHTVLAIARFGGWELPAGYEQNAAIHQAAADLARNAAPKITSDPTDPAKVAKWVNDAARARVEHEHTADVAAALADRAELEWIRCALDAANSYARPLADWFNERAERFAALAATAPHAIDVNTAPDEFEAHKELLKLAAALTVGSQYRAALAVATGENETFGREPLWLVLDPAKTASISAIRAAVRANLHPTDIDSWTNLTVLGCSMASHGEAQRRREQFMQLEHQHGIGRRDPDAAISTAEEMARAVA